MLQAIRGMSDILPDKTHIWRFIEQSCEAVFSSYHYREIRMPLLEPTELFKRSIGEVTDIVEKEMYTFLDRNGDSLSLRPEGTAGCVRACLEHGLMYQKHQKLWYKGPMFRHEKPQKGRYRQFHQLGVEVLGLPGYAIELELIGLCQALWDRLGLSQAVTLEINSLGTLAERAHYKGLLVDYFQAHVDQLDEESVIRLGKNPLRLLDSKSSAIQSLIADAPKLLDVLGPESREHFDALCAGLTALGISYCVNPSLVRGLDYYAHTVFEWTTTLLGAQGTICAGGRFDQLVEYLGGKPTPAVGFAIGLERLILLYEAMLGDSMPLEPVPDIMIMTEHEGLWTDALVLATSLRRLAPHWRIDVNTGQGRLKSQFKKADKSGACWAVILGTEEMRKGSVSLKNLRALDATQQTVLMSDLYTTLCTYLGA